MEVLEGFYGFFMNLRNPSIRKIRDLFEFKNWDLHRWPVIFAAVFQAAPVFPHFERFLGLQ